MSEEVTVTVSVRLSKAEYLAWTAGSLLDHKLRNADDFLKREIKAIAKRCGWERADAA